MDMSDNRNDQEIKETKNNPERMLTEDELNKVAGGIKEPYTVDTNVQYGESIKCGM